MLLLVAVAIGSGLLAAVVLTPISALAALIIAPLIASMAAIVACFAIAWQSTGGGRQVKALDAQTDAMVAALRDVAQQGAVTSPIPKVRVGHEAARIQSA
ncbi:hypothetical protein ACLBX9_27140 [Methylobacterium sp. A49B]